jgi:protein-S-isoprenylcysteine O-methyltransferase Ste14
LTRQRGDIVTVFLVDAFGGAAIVVSVLDFFLLQGRSLSGADPLGLVIFLVGVGMTASALGALRGQYTLKVKTSVSQTLVQSGLYRFIRHPVYLGLILVFFSASIAWTSAYGALLAVPTIPLLLRRIGIEESAMALRFGDEYASYRQKTKRLVPFVY